MHSTFVWQRIGQADLRRTTRHSLAPSPELGQSDPVSRVYVISPMADEICVRMLVLEEERKAKRNKKIIRRKRMHTWIETCVTLEHNRELEGITRGFSFRIIIFNIDEHRLRAPATAAPPVVKGDVWRAIADPDKPALPVVFGHVLTLGSPVPAKRPWVSKR